MRAVALVFFGLAVYYRGLVAAEDADEAVGELLDPCLAQGLTKPQEGPCLKCRCVSDTAQPKYECTVTECMRGQCVDGHTPPGECCPVCPNGRNCEANGQVIPFGPVVELDNGDQCYCANVQGRWGELEAVCQTPLTQPYD